MYKTDPPATELYYSTRASFILPYHDLNRPLHKICVSLVRCDGTSFFAQRHTKPPQDIPVGKWVSTNFNFDGGRAGKLLLCSRQLRVFEALA